MNLLIDFGNTAIKAATFAQGKIHSLFTGVTPSELEDILKTNPISQMACVSVTQEHLSWTQRYPETVVLTPKTDLPIQLAYETPQTLGMDRVAAACGARFHFPQQHCLVIDAGTCMTMEMLTKDGLYLGGSISPGVHMRFKAMNNFTSGLPLVEEIRDVPFIGKSTIECMQSGVLNGIRKEVHGFVEDLRIDFTPLTVVLTGGDAQLFESMGKEGIFVRPNLVMEGLNFILEEL